MSAPAQASLPVTGGLAPALSAVRARLGLVALLFAVAALAWADAALGAQEIVAIIAPENAASIRVAEKTGFEDCSEARYRDEKILLFRRRASAESPAA